MKASYEKKLNIDKKRDRSFISQIGMANSKNEPKPFKAEEKV